VEYISAPQFSAPPNWPQPSTGLLDGSKWRPRSSRCYSSRREAWLPTARQDAGRPQIRGDRVSEPVSDSRSRPATLLPRSGRQPGPAALAQSAERLTRNEKVVGSIPTGGSLRSPRSEPHLTWGSVFSGPALRRGRERVGDPRSVLADHVGVHPQRDRRIGVDPAARPLHGPGRRLSAASWRGHAAGSCSRACGRGLAGRFDGCRCTRSTSTVPGSRLTVRSRPPGSLVRSSRHPPSGG
jgi:hypothetical protein